MLNAVILKCNKSYNIKKEAIFLQPLFFNY